MKISWQLNKLYPKQFWIGISLYKKSWKGGNYFPTKFLNSKYFIIIAQSHHRMSQNTYMRTNYHVQVKKLHKMKICDHELSPLLMQNPYSKFTMILKTLSFDQIPKFWQVLLQQIEI